jgi:hypothetical protein
MRRPDESPAKLVELVYELLDAHDDTMRLAQGTACEEDWAAHLDYLRSLQRVGREQLAHACEHSQAEREPVLSSLAGRRAPLSDRYR